MIGSHKARVATVWISLAAAVVVGLVVLGKTLRHGVAQTPASELVRVSCRLKWLHQSQFAGYYVAVSQGFYREAGIACDLQPGGQDFSSIKLVAAGSDDFGVCGADEILIARSKGIPVVAMAVIYQESPVCFFAKKESGIRTPSDFVGKNVAMQYGTNVRTEYVAMMKRLGIPLDKVTEIPSRFDMQRFFSGDVDVWNGYTINEVQTASERGFDVVVIRPFDYGIRMYADCLFTTEEMVAKKPNLVTAFVGATIRGWKKAVSLPDEAIATVLQVDSRLNREHEQKMLAASIPLIVTRSADEHGIGWMAEERWREMEETLFGQGIIERRVLVDHAFTNAFLPTNTPLCSLTK